MATAVSLAQSRLYNGDAVAQGVVDEFVKSGWMMANIPFVPVQCSINPGAGWAYTYNRVSTNPTAATRSIGAEYTSVASEVTQHTVLMSILGGTFDIDVALADQGNGAEIAFQIEQKVKGASAKFSDLLINGNDNNAGEFDGLDVALTSTDNEVDGSAHDLTVVDTQAEANAFLFHLDNLLSLVQGDNLAIVTNRQGLNRLRSVTRQAGASQVSEVRGQRPVDSYAGVPIIDLGAKPGSNDPIVEVYTNATPDPDVTGCTDIYVVSLGEAGFHGITPAGRDQVKVTLPNFDSGTSLATGRVEMVASAVLKNTKAAAVLRTVKVA